MDIWSITIEQVTELLNQSKEIILEKLKDEGEITEEQCLNWSQKYLMSMGKPKWFCSWFKKDKFVIIVSKIDQKLIDELKTEKDNKDA